MICKDFSEEQLFAVLPSGNTLAWYVTEIEAWISRASVPRKELNNLPTCPFAKKEAGLGNIQYEIIYMKNQEGEVVCKKSHLKAIEDFYKGPKKTMVIIVDDVPEISQNKGINLAAQLTKSYNRKGYFKDERGRIAVLAANKKDDSEAYIQLPPFLVFLVQYEDELYTAESYLEHLGYYKNINKDKLVIDGTMGEAAHPMIEDDIFRQLMTRFDGNNDQDSK